MELIGYVNFFNDDNAISIHSIRLSLGIFLDGNGGVKLLRFRSLGTRARLTCGRKPAEMTIRVDKIYMMGFEPLVDLGRILSATNVSSGDARHHTKISTKRKE